jgi:hypothetical protein
MTSTENASPSVVLVHGAYADGSSWSEVIKLPHGAGVTATAVQHPLTSLTGDAARTSYIQALQQGPVILAGHSSGAAVPARLPSPAQSVIKTRAPAPSTASAKPPPNSQEESQRVHTERDARTGDYKPADYALAADAGIIAAIEHRQTSYCMRTLSWS